MSGLNQTETYEVGLLHRVVEFNKLFYVFSATLYSLLGFQLYYAYWKDRKEEESSVWKRWGNLNWVVLVFVGLLPQFLFPLVQSPLHVTPYVGFLMLPSFFLVFAALDPHVRLFFPLGWIGFWFAVPQIMPWIFRLAFEPKGDLPPLFYFHGHIHIILYVALFHLLLYNLDTTQVRKLFKSAFENVAPPGLAAACLLSSIGSGIIGAGHSSSSMILLFISGPVLWIPRWSGQQWYKIWVQLRALLGTVQTVVHLALLLPRFDNRVGTALLESAEDRLGYDAWTDALLACHWAVSLFVMIGSIIVWKLRKANAAPDLIRVELHSVAVLVYVLLSRVLMFLVHGSTVTIAH